MIKYQLEQELHKLGNYSLNVQDLYNINDLDYDTKRKTMQVSSKAKSDPIEPAEP